MKNYKLKLKPLTPIIIGTGKELEAFEYAMITDNGSAKLYAIDMLNFIANLDESGQEDFFKSMEGNLIGLRNKVSQYAQSIAASPNVQRFSFGVKDNVALMYREKIEGVENQLAISLFERTGGKPYIPGSSIKGALRTGLGGARMLADTGFKAAFDQIARSPRDKERMIEKSLFGHQSPNDDLLRTIKVSDSAALETEVVLTERCSFKQGKEGTKIPALKEAAKIGQETEASIAENPEIAAKAGGPRKAMRVTNIIKACRLFYGEVLKSEIDFFDRNPSSRIKCDLSWTKMAEQAASGTLGETHFPLRLGWGSGKPSTTVSILCGERAPVSKSLVNKGHEHIPLGWIVASLEK